MTQRVLACRETNQSPERENALPQITEQVMGREDLNLSLLILKTEESTVCLRAQSVSREVRGTSPWRRGGGGAVSGPGALTRAPNTCVPSSLLGKGLPSCSGLTEI